MISTSCIKGPLLLAIVRFSSSPDRFSMRFCQHCIFLYQAGGPQCPLVGIPGISVTCWRMTRQHLSLANPRGAVS